MRSSISAPILCHAVLLLKLSRINSLSCRDSDADNCSLRESIDIAARKSHTVSPMRWAVPSLCIRCKNFMACSELISAITRKTLDFACIGWVRVGTAFSIVDMGRNKVVPPAFENDPEGF